jgi:hypothetical protein
MSPGDIISDLSPHARVATAVLPFAIAVGMRVVLGANRLTRWLISLSVMWFAANVLMAPYSAGMREDLQNLRTLLP